MPKKSTGDVSPPAETAVATSADRSKAYKLRAKMRGGGTLLPSEEDWLRAYEAAKRAAGAPDVGASASEKIVHVEERHAAMGTGEAATHAAAAGAMIREEGKRLDVLIAQATAAMSAGMTSMQRACELHQAMAENMLADRMADREEMRTLMASIRTHYLARIDAEGAAAKAQQPEGNELEQVLQLLQEIRVASGSHRVIPGGKTGSAPGSG